MRLYGEIGERALKAGDTAVVEPVLPILEELKPRLNDPERRLIDRLRLEFQKRTSSKIAGGTSNRQPHHQT